MANNNKHMGKAKEQQRNEFYTQIGDIERELRYYKDHFRGKIIFCNCDDPEYSNFWKYFELNFEEFGLKKLIATHFDAEKPSYKLELMADIDGDGRITGRDIIKTPLIQNGDFRSPECIEILKEADIVITNPPFSLFREYIAQLMEYKKKFVIIGPQNSLHYKEVFPLIQENKVWLGYGFPNNVGFFINTVYEDYATSSQHIEGMIRVNGVIWLTNLDIPKRHEELTLYKEYNPLEYITYDNYDAINVGDISSIPIDYFGDMGVPDTFLQKYNPDQFEIVGLGCGDMAKKIGIKKNYRGRTDLAYTDASGKQKCPYSRIIVRRKR